jgi:hypothetical protein
MPQLLEILCKNEIKEVEPFVTKHGGCFLYLTKGFHKKLKLKYFILY